MNYLDKIKRLYQLKDSNNNFGFKESELIEVENQKKINLPKKLKEYYLTLGKNESINRTHNRLLKPSEIGFSKDKYLVFYEENQCVVIWGIKEKDLHLKNPPVWGNYGSNESPDWQLQAKTTDNFFLLMSFYNGTFGGLEYNANSFDPIDNETVKIIKKKCVEITDVNWSKQKFYTDEYDEIISLCFDEKENCTAIFIGTNNKNRFDKILNTINIEWDYVSSEEE